MEKKSASPTPAQSAEDADTFFTSDEEQAPASTEVQQTQEFDPEAGTKPPPKGQGAAAGGAIKPAGKAKITALGDFRLTKKLGQGGMGAVYKAQQISLEREVAVKVLAKHLADNPAFVQRFQREAKIMAKLDHPNILRCYAVGEAHGMHYFAMEFVDGSSMEGWLKKLGKLSVGDALHVTLACAKALQHAHELTLVHRDVKPDNVLLTRKGVVKVADLGLAKAISDDLGLTRTGTGAGTPIYMSPEQGRDVKHVDGRTDIYSLGCMLYCFLTGEPPFKGETYVELFEAKELGKFPPARKVNGAVPERLDLIIDKMLAKKVEHRYQSCAEVIKDLEGLSLANETLSFLEAKAAATPSRPVAKPAAKAEARPIKAAFRPAAAEPEPVAPGFFYVSYKTRDGKAMTRKLTEQGVLDLIKEESFDPDTQVSKTLKGGYRALATYREFEPALRARMTRSKADKKAEKYKSMYEKIVAEDEKQRRWRWLRNLKRKFTSGVSLIIWLAVLAGGSVLIYMLIHYFMDKVDGK